MAQDEVYAGPMSESIPSSVASFAHRRATTDSIASFTYFQEDDEEPSFSDEEAILDASDDDEDYADGDDRDLEAGSLHSWRRKSSGRSAASADRPLLPRHTSHRSDTRDYGLKGSFSQKLYLDTEDLTIVIAGFNNSIPGYLTYLAICFLTAGSPARLRECTWVVIENQWGEFTVHPITVEAYGQPLSTVFDPLGKEAVNGYNYEEDPVLDFLRILDYRYMKLIYHPLEDIFMLNNSWKDPNWNDVLSLRAGLDSDERDVRNQVFGKNMIDIHQKTTPQLLLDELPCDSLLLAGDCIINESMLTGESVPVSKVPMTDEAMELLDDVEDDEAVALAMVVRTGFNTTKGALVRSMLFPKPSGFKFYRDSFRYISVMACVAAVGFVASFVNFIRLGLAWHLIVVRALDLITIVVPPALPATLTIGTNFALQRLKKQQIFCISPQRVNVGGKLDVVAFDKTGTLTEDGLDVLGCRVVHLPDMRFSELLEDASELLPSAVYERDPTVNYDIHKSILYTMATCHSLRMVDGELIGDPLDVKMFEFTRWTYEEGLKNTTRFGEPRNTAPVSIARPPAGMDIDIDDSHEGNEPVQIELGILRSFDFVSQLRRASVMVRQHGDRGVAVFVKGAPEALRDICQGSSLPEDYDDLLSYYTHRGFRVIACASRYIKNSSWDDIQGMTRFEVESELQFGGFIVFENKLKETTTEVIDELNDASIRVVMCTGDNILTAISVARECHLIGPEMQCFVPHFVEGDLKDPKARLCWESIDNGTYQLDEHTLTPLARPNEIDGSNPYAAYNVGNYTIAVSGDVFRWVIDYGSEEVLKRMLVVGSVFARMSPDEKHELVEKLQSIDYCAGFCGDGANDCGALKAADVGISLSEAEASVAAPFTSRVFDISCVPKVIREGRASLVTSFCCFKYMSLYSAIQFCSVSFLYASASNLADFQFLFIDLALIVPVAVFMVPFVVAIVVTLILSLYMLLDPAEWLARFMELTEISLGFAFILLLLAIIGFIVAYISERYFFPVLAKLIGLAKKKWGGPKRQKQRKEYKILLEDVKQHRK
ncbi:putative p-type atpase [Phaeomoniella chlamydospora]|uniref:Cation-transporting ATPase n=1 Tax=Phaeomoniella chlamydospora TaxID=158046 RepID=A0A0G2H1P7_PHACM|nr:putative p-type atpase [Phaeomoniella chlamydospora]